MEFPASFGFVVLESFDEEFGAALDLKEVAAIVGSAGDEEGTGTVVFFRWRKAEASPFWIIEQVQRMATQSLSVIRS